MLTVSTKPVSSFVKLTERGHDGENTTVYLNINAVVCIEPLYTLDGKYIGTFIDLCAGRSRLCVTEPLDFVLSSLGVNC